jgi:riboflavin synthase alpha subunit
MTIKSKFDINERVYLVHDSHMTLFTIRSISWNGYCLTYVLLNGDYQAVAFEDELTREKPAIGVL